MKKALHLSLFSAVLFLAPVYVALAHVTSESNSPTTPQPFTFYCDPYKLPFTEGYHYIADASAKCHYTIPQTGQFKAVALYKGTIGNAVPVQWDFTVGPSSSLETTPNNFGTSAEGQEYFAASYSGSVEDLATTDLYLQMGIGSPTADLTVLNWKWGPKPASEFDPVIIIPGILGSWERNGEWVIGPMGHVYDEFIDTFKSNGYQKNVNLFEFGYDWRESNASNAVILAQGVQNIKQLCNCSHVDIVAHSMGGLVAREYLQNNFYQNDVDQVVFLAVPHQGAPFAYLTWEGGVLEFGDPLRDLILKAKFALEARSNLFTSIFAYIQNRPVSSIHELLPTYNYLLNTSSEPHNLFLENLNSDAGFLNLTTGKIRIFNITSDNGLVTQIGYIVSSSDELPKWEHGKPTETFFGQGDGTVPAQSSNWLPVNKVFFGIDHNTVVASSTKYVFELLNNKQPGPIAIGTGIYRKLENTSNILTIKLYSPIDMQLTAPNGKRLGKNFETGEEFDEIPDAFYSGFLTDNEYLVIVDPLPGEYTLKTKGTGNGEYAIVADLIDEQGFIETELTNTTTKEQLIEHTLSIGDKSIELEKNVPKVQFGGFLPPLNITNPIFKLGSTIPVKFQLKDEAGELVQLATAPIFKVGDISLGTFKYDLLNQQYVFNWETKGLAKGQHLISALVEGITYSMTVGLK